MQINGLMYMRNCWRNKLIDFVESGETMKEKVLIFGTGSVAEVLVEEIDSNKVEIVAFINSNIQIKEFHGYRVIQPEQMKSYEYDYIIVASGYYLQIEKILLELGIDKNKIIGFIFDEDESYQGMSQNLGNYLDIRYNRNHIYSMLKTNRLYPNLYASVIWKNNCFSRVDKDFVKEQLMSLLAQEIERKQVKGSVAELGVFRGDFTVSINRALPMRKIYLFDTFCGFSAEDVNEDDNIKNKENELLKFHDTSEEFVLSRLNVREGQCIVRGGVFPDTFDLYDEKFCFVSVDLNMYQPVLKSLELFYPRVCAGGYIMISCYNAPFYEGTRKAIIDYCDEHNINFLPVPDLYGSVVICK